jgi:hypothetical protein
VTSRQDGQERPGKARKRPGKHKKYQESQKRPGKTWKNLERPGKVRESQERRKAWNGGMNKPEEAYVGKCVHERSQQRPGKNGLLYLSPRKVNTCQEWKKPVWTGYESGGTRKERNRTRRGHCGQEKSQEGQGRKGTGSSEATVVRRGVMRDKERKEQDHLRPLWSRVESGGTRKEWNRIR